MGHRTKDPRGQSRSRADSVEACDHSDNSVPDGAPQFSVKVRETVGANRACRIRRR